MNVAVLIVTSFVLSLCASAAPEKLPIRLSGKQKPFHYDLHFRFREHFRFDGKVVVKLQITEPTTVFTLHADPVFINITHISVRSLHRNTLIELNRKRMWALNHEIEEGLSIFLSDVISPGSYEIALGYSAVLCRGRKGYVYCGNTSAIDYVDFATTFEPLGARTFFPCFDEPYMKATFSVAIEHDPQVKAISNGRAINTTIRADDTAVTYFETTPRMSTYLLTLAVGNFTTICNASRHNVHCCINVPTSIQEANRERMQSSLDQYIYQLDRLTDFFQVGYPLPKMDIVAPPVPFSAMENWGIIVHGYSILNATEVIIHELVHQWFGNLVTMEDWCQLWLNEGFANYMEYIFTERKQELPYMVVWTRRSAPDKALALNCPFADRNSLAQIKSIFSAMDVVYIKGSCTIKIMHQLMGDDDFYNAIRGYIRSNAYGSTTSTNLIDHLSAHTSLPLAQVRLTSLLITYIVFVLYIDNCYWWARGPDQSTN